MTNVIFASFSSPDLAKKAAGALLDHGIRGEHISIVFPEGYVITDEAGHTGMDLAKGAETGITTTTAADAGAGAAMGAGIGLAAGTLAALAAVFIPGFGLVLGGGALAVALGGVAGSTVAGAAAGGVTGYLKDQGVPDASLHNYNQVIKSGGAMISVTPYDEKTGYAEIKNVLTKYEGVVDMHPLEVVPASPVSVI